VVSLEPEELGDILAKGRYFQTRNTKRLFLGWAVCLTLMTF
jgi:hypothetical protein